MKNDYERGANEAWECAKKIILTVNDGGISAGTLYNLFGFKGCEDIIKNISAVDAITTLTEYLEKKDEIKVGTRVRTLKDVSDGVEVFPIGTIGVVGMIDGQDACPYRVDIGEDYWWYSEDMFEVIPEDEIIVGDEVINKMLSKNPAICTKLNKNLVDRKLDHMYLLFSDGSSGYFEVDCYTRTGRYFPQINELLEQIKEGSEN